MNGRITNFILSIGGRQIRTLSTNGLMDAEKYKNLKKKTDEYAILADEKNQGTIKRNQKLPSSALNENARKMPADNERNQGTSSGSRQQISTRTKRRRVTCTVSRQFGTYSHSRLDNIFYKNCKITTTSALARVIAEKKKAADDLNTPRRPKRRY
ncbi:uncharacterized protein LOC119690236 [Teleopsis dalmanni]|uniref:uncharacterized protein LOC119687007 n=1 Tax=Teleopsis dalmanni TaxID=139649 RepID=UPI0018CF91B9|nr:uncharacterized protein LOC119687007 [Teleopsis dalmanni]XP_037959480.1 uncharacterized protein LOC119688888 [Teleopsis dalmanni]XP_037961181.1 uncharacterized protein LOC119690236 [Teleopsis dalmanni]